MPSKTVSVIIIASCIALVFASLLFVGNSTVPDTTVEDTVQKSLDDTLVLDHSEIKTDTPFVIPREYKIVFSKADHKYAVKFIYPDRSYILGRTKFSSGFSVVGFADRGDEWQLDDSTACIALIKQHWKQILDDRNAARNPHDDTKTTDYK